MTLERFFAGQDESWRIFDALRLAVATIGHAELQLRVTKSQVAFRRRRPFAWAWMPGMYLQRPRPTPLTEGGQGGIPATLPPRYAPLVLTVALRRRDPSPRWKEVVEPAPGRFTHHLELRSAAEIDDEVRAWLREAWEAAG